MYEENTNNNNIRGTTAPCDEATCMYCNSPFFEEEHVTF